MARNRNSNFGLRGCFKCAVCDRRTRATGAQALGSELCAECWELAGLDNLVNDCGSEALTEGLKAERDALLKRAVELGSNAEKIKAANDYLFA